jgi:hypothetical protein
MQHLRTIAIIAAALIVVLCAGIGIGRMTSGFSFNQINQRPPNCEETLNPQGGPGQVKCDSDRAIHSTTFPTPTAKSVVTLTGSVTNYCITEPDKPQVMCVETQGDVLQATQGKTIQAVLYSDAEYKGQALFIVTNTSVCLGVGNLPAQWNDRVSSVRISGECTLTVYEHFDAQDVGSPLYDVRPPGTDTDRLTVLVKQISSWRLSP